jgi:hypothetical protein
MTNAGVTYANLLAAAGASQGAAITLPAGLTPAALAAAYATTPSGSGGGGSSGGIADIDVIDATPVSGNTNISGTGVTVATTFDTLNSTPVTRVTVTGTTGGIQREVKVYFTTSTGAVQAVSYSWGTSLGENIVYCPAAGCTGVSVNQNTKEIFFSNTMLDNNNPFTAADKFATLSIGGIQYP